MFACKSNRSEDDLLEKKQVKPTCDHTLKQAAYVTLPVLQHALVLFLLAGNVHCS